MRTLGQDLRSFARDACLDIPNDDLQNPPIHHKPIRRNKKMNPEKQQYLNTIRSNSAYPTYRGIIGIITILGYIIAGLVVVAGLAQWMGGAGNFIAVLGSLVVGALIFLLAKCWKEGAEMLADIADSITDSNSRSSQ